MGIFHVSKKDLNGKIVESYTMQNVILDAGLEYLCGQGGTGTGVGNDFNLNPQIGVGTNDITPDTNQIGLISPVANGLNTATFTSKSLSTTENTTGNNQFTV